MVQAEVTTPVVPSGSIKGIDFEEDKDTLDEGSIQQRQQQPFGSERELRARRAPQMFGYKEFVAYDLFIGGLCWLAIFV